MIRKKLQTVWERKKFKKRQIKEKIINERAKILENVLEYLIYWYTHRYFYIYNWQNRRSRRRQRNSEEYTLCIRSLDRTRTHMILFFQIACANCELCKVKTKKRNVFYMRFMKGLVLCEKKLQLCSDRRISFYCYSRHIQKDTAK